MQTNEQRPSPSERVVTVTPSGAWQVTVRIDEPGSPPSEEEMALLPPTEVRVEDEVVPSLPDYDADAWGGWQKGLALPAIRASECTTCHALVPDSLQVRTGAAPDGERLEPGRDYELEPDWGSLGRLPGGRIAPETPVRLTYTYTPQRVDSIVREPSGKLALRVGEPHNATPRPPPLAPGDLRLANIHTEGQMTRIDADHCFPIMETTGPEDDAADGPVAEHLLPETMRRLRAGDTLRVLAWGDSVTEGTFLDDPSAQRWQAQFVARLARRFPDASIELITEAWGGRTTSAYLAEPPGALHNYQEKVLDAKPDLIVMEFVNDAGLPAELYPEQYERLLADFRGIGAEWIILTPHYIRPDWMGLTSQREIDEDPRAYTSFLREFAATHGVALADAARRYGRLWRQGLPYNTLMTNNINHPDERGMRIFADSLMALWGR